MSWSQIENAHADWESQGWDIAIPAHAVWAALAKTRQLYLAVAAEQGRNAVG